MVFTAAYFSNYKTSPIYNIHPTLSAFDNLVEVIDTGLKFYTKGN